MAETTRSSTVNYMDIPGIAQRTVHDLNMMSQEQKMRKAVMIGFRNPKMKENYDRNMSGLVAQYKRMVGSQLGQTCDWTGDTGSAAKTNFAPHYAYQARIAFPLPMLQPPPKFDTKSNDAVRPPPRPARPYDAERHDILGRFSRQSYTTMKYQAGQAYSGETRRAPSTRTRRKSVRSEEAANYRFSAAKEPSWTSALQRFGGAVEQNKTTNLPSASGESRDTVTHAIGLHHSIHHQMHAMHLHHTSGGVSQSTASSIGTPTESMLNFGTPLSSPNSVGGGKQPSPPLHDGADAHDVVAFHTLTEEELSAAPWACGNPRVKEKVRMHNKAPTAAGMRYLSQLDRVANNEYNQLHAIKFDKRRVGKWVEVVADNSSEHEETNLRRSASEPAIAYSDVACSLFSDKSSAEKETQQLFAEMHSWMHVNKVGKWPLDDAQRVKFAGLRGAMLVRVVDAAAAAAVTVVPPVAYDELLCTLRAFEENMGLAQAARTNDRRVVIVQQAKDESGGREFQRGWLLDGDEETARVLLMELRKVVRVPRAQVADCPSVLAAKPPLCVAAEFTRQFTDSELELLQEGRDAYCTVVGIRVPETDWDTTVLRLRLERINAEGKLLDQVFCSEECAGGCNHPSSHAEAY